MADRYAVLQKLGDGQNALLGVAAGGIEAAATQPLTYAKNCFQQRTPLSLVPRVVYRGTPASMAADGTLIGTQFACCGFLQKRVWTSNLQPDFNVRVCGRFDASSLVVLRELDESHRFVQKSAESTSM